jgi:nitroreductase
MIMELKQIIEKNRSYRRFYQQERISDEQLRSWVDLARLSASGANKQVIKYLLLNSETDCDKLFPMLGWAGYLKDWAGPENGEQPAAYIVMLADTRIAKQYYCDHGIASQSILLGAVNEGFGGCIVANVQRTKVIEAFHIPDYFEVIQVIALGKPKEVVVIEEVATDGDIRYWRDAQGVHHVPKRSLDEIIWK